MQNTPFQPSAPILTAGDDAYVYLNAQALPLAKIEHAVMHLLLRRSPEVVSKNEFAEQVWHGRDMSDESLARCIHKIRRTLKALGAGHRIASVYGKGYRLSGTFATVSSGHAGLQSMAQAPTPLAEAYIYARQLLQQRTPAAFEQAETILRDIIAKAPTLVQARLALAECLAASNKWAVQIHPRRLEEGLEQLAAAQTLTPYLPGAAAIRAYLLDAAWRFDEAETACLQALRDDPNVADTYFHYGRHLLFTGRANEARHAVRAAAQLNPYSPLFRVLLSMAHCHAGHADDALREADVACKLSGSNMMALTYSTKLRAWCRPGQELVKTAIQLTLSPHAVSTVAPSVLSYVLARAGLKEDAMDVVHACLHCASSNPCIKVLHVSTLLECGQDDGAIALVKDAVQARCSLLPMVLYDPANAALRDHPDYSALFAQVFARRA